MKKLRWLLLVPVLPAVLLLTACTASQMQQTEQLLAIGVNAIPSLVTLLGGSQNAVAHANTVKTDFALAQTLTTGYNAKAASATTTAQRINALLSDAEANLNGIVSAVPATDANRQKISAVASLLIGVTQDILADLPNATGKATLAHPVKLPKPSAVQGQLNAIFAQ